jgi:hypothetical protein
MARARGGVEGWDIALKFYVRGSGHAARLARKIFALTASEAVDVSPAVRLCETRARWLAAARERGRESLAFQYDALNLEHPLHRRPRGDA